jgi:phosphate transport system permease protein
MSVVSINSPTPTSEQQKMKRERLVKRLNRYNILAVSLLWLVTILVAVIFIAILLNIVWNGSPTFFADYFYTSGTEGVLSELFNTFYILILTELILFPVALGAAIFLVEYVKKGPLVTVIHFAAETLAGVPSLILGMFGLLLFTTTMHMGVSRLAGALTLLCLNLPLGLRLFEDALNAVPQDLREGSLALGSTRWHTIRTVVLPSALPGLITGLILTAGKVIGEAAAILFTMGTNNPNDVFTFDPRIASDTLTTRLYYLQTSGARTSGLSQINEAHLVAGLAATLIILLLVINISARSIGRLIQRNITAA